MGKKYYYFIIIVFYKLFKLFIYIKNYSNTVIKNNFLYYFIVIP